MEQAAMTTAAPAAQPAPQQPGTEIGNAKPNGTPAEAKTVEQQLFEMKVNGKVRKYTADELKAKASLGESATEKFEAASQKEKKYQDWKQSAAKNAIEALMDPELGLTKEQIKSQFEHWYNENFIEPETLTEEQKQLREYEKKVKAYEEKEKKEAEKKEAETKSEEEKREFNAVQKEIIETLEASDLPKTRAFARKLAFYMKQNAARGYNAPKEVLVGQVKNEVAQDFQHFFGNSTVDQIISVTGEEFIDKIRQYDIARLKNQLGQREESQVVKARPPKTKSMRDVDMYLNELRRKR